MKNAEKYCPRFPRLPSFRPGGIGRLVGRLVEIPNLGTGDDSISENIQ